MAVHRPHRHGRQYLLIVDHDHERFTVEGPVYDSLPWTEEIERAKRSGRQIDFRLVPNAKVNSIVEWANANGYEQWPEKSIINPIINIGLPKPSYRAATEAAAEPGTDVIVAELDASPDLPERDEVNEPEH